MKCMLVAFALFAAPALAEPAACAYPAEAGTSTGTTTIGFTAQSDGTLARVALRHSSGNAALDQAAVACVAQWHFDPASKDDQHWIAPGLTAIVWKKGADQQLTGLRFGVPHYCAYVPMRDQSGDTTLSFSITETGRVRDAAVAASSGDASLDQSAVTCAERWRYKAALKDNQAVTVPWTAKVLWSEEIPDGPVVVIEPVNLPSPQTP